MLFTKEKVLNSPDETFGKLFDVVINDLPREEVREYLKEYKFVEEGSLPYYKEIFTDYYYLPNVTPRPSTRIFYDKDKLSSSAIWLTYSASLNKFIAEKHRGIMFKKLDSFLNDKLGGTGVEKGLTFWQKGFTFVIKNLYEEKDGRLGIIINLFNTQRYPVEKIFEDYEKKEGIYAPIEVRSFKGLFLYPAKKEYFVKFLKIEAVNPDGQNKLLILHTKEDINNPKNKLILYCDKVFLGETLELAIKRTLKDNFGLEEVRYFYPSDTIETAPDKQGNVLQRCLVFVGVGYKELRIKKWGSFFVSWVEVEKVKKLLDRFKGTEKQEVAS